MVDRGRKFVGKSVAPGAIPRVIEARRKTKSAAGRDNIIIGARLGKKGPPST